MPDSMLQWELASTTIFELLLHVAQTPKLLPQTLSRGILEALGELLDLSINITI